MTLLDSALAFHRAGFCVIPAAVNGTKSPLGSLGLWGRYKIARSTEDELAEWFSGVHPGIGIITGHISQNAEMLEWEGRAVREGIYTQFCLAMVHAGYSELLQRITAGYSESTPSGGIHTIYRVIGTVSGNTKLAQRLARDDELNEVERELRAQGKQVVRVLMETRGEGGFVVVAPSHGTTHETGRPWAMTAGGPATVARITETERTEIMRIARSFDQLPVEEAPVQRVEAPSDEIAPGEAYSQDPLVSWSHILLPSGWTLVHDQGHRAMWRRPGKSRGVSAISGGNPDLLYVFSTSTVLPADQGLSKWRVHAHLNYGGDFSATASALRRDGYGSPRAERPRLTVIKSPDQPQEEGEQDLLTRGDLRSLKEPKWIIQDTLGESSYMLLAGRRSSYKSFQALSWGLACATGVPWMERETRKTKVLYLHFEGSPAYLNKRIEAWETFHHDIVEDNAFITKRKPLSLFTEMGTNELIDIVSEGEFGLVIIDTLRRVSGRAKGNDNTEMGIVIDNIERVKRSTADNGSVLVIAHTGKTDGSDTRGASCIEDDADIVWYSERGQDNFFALRSGKMKDSEDGQELSMYAKWMGQSLVAIPDPQDEDKPSPLFGGGSGKLMELIDETFGDRTFSKSDLMKACESVMPPRLVYRGLTELVRRGTLRQSGTDQRPTYNVPLSNRLG